MQSNPELLPADLFLERFSLPRVVRISKKYSDETMQSSSSNGSSSASAVSSTSITNKKESMELTQPNNGELFLLYRYLRNRKIYHGINAKNGANRKKGVMIPQEFSGKSFFFNSSHHISVKPSQLIFTFLFFGHRFASLIVSFDLFVFISRVHLVSLVM